MTGSLFPSDVILPVEAWCNLGASSRSKINAEWLHEASGWRVRHCGHPTALWPYYLIPPDGMLSVMSHNGRGFTSGAIGRAAVESILSGALAVLTADCVDGIGRLLLTCDGKPID